MKAGPRRMASSLRAGMQALAGLNPAATGVVVALADQPNFSRRSIQQLLAEQGPQRTATSPPTAAAPSCLRSISGSRYFPELAAQAGEDVGARPAAAPP